MRAQELYNSYCRKEITENDFLYHIRRDQLLKEFISPVNNSQDVITILKNRGQIAQQIAEDQLIETPEEDEHGETFPVEPEYGEELAEEKKINQPDYKYYTCQIFQDGSLNICEGFEYENDAKDSKKDEETYGRDNFIIKVLTKRFLTSKGVNPDDNKYWHGPKDDGTKGGSAKLKAKKEDAGDFEDDYIHEGYDDEERYEEIDEKFGTPEVRDTLENNDQLGFDFMGEAMNAILLDGEQYINDLDLSQEDKDQLKDWRNDILRKIKIKGKPTVNEAKKATLTADQVNYYEFTKGWRHELQATDDLDKAKEKALKNLTTDPLFYTNLIIKQTTDKQKHDPKNNKEVILKAPTDQVELKDRENQMKNAKKKDPVKSNVKTNLGNQERAKTANPKSVKIMKLKESIKNLLKDVLKESDNQHVEAARAMTKMDPVELAKQILGGQLPMSGFRAEFAGKVLGKAIASGNSDQSVKDAFHKLSDKSVNETDKKKDEGFFGSKKPSNELKVEDLKKGDFIKSKGKSNIIYKIDSIENGNIEVIIVANDAEKELDGKNFEIGQRKKINPGGLKNIEIVKDPKNIKLNADPKYFNVNESKEWKCPTCGRNNTDEDRCRCLTPKDKLKEDSNNGIVEFKKGDYLKPDKYNIIFKVDRIDDDVYVLKIVANDEKVGMKGEEFKTGDYVDFPVYKMSNFKKVNPNDIKLDANPKYFNQNESYKGEKEILDGWDKEWNKHVIEILKTSLKTDVTVAKKIFDHYKNDFKKAFDAGKTDKDAVKDFLKNVKKVKEEYEGNVGPEEADWIDTELEEKKKTVSKVHPVEGAMHKVLGLKPEETIASKYKTGEELYNALSRKVKDHKKLTGMLAYAANIHKGKDVFDAALHHSKKVNGNKKDLNESLNSLPEDRKKIYQKAFQSLDQAKKSAEEYFSNKRKS